jgi:hypothetical protein
MLVNLVDIVRRTNALSDITFYPQDLIHQPLRVQNAPPMSFRISVGKDNERQVELTRG